MKSHLLILFFFLFSSWVLANEEALRLFRSRRDSFTPLKRPAFPGDDKLMEMVPQFHHNSRRHTFSVQGLKTSVATVSLSYDITSPYSFRYLESVPGVVDVAYDQKGLYVLLEEGTSVSEFSDSIFSKKNIDHHQGVALATQMEWRGGLSEEDTFHTRVPTGPIQEIAENVVFLPSKEANVLDVASAAKIDFTLLPHYENLEEISKRAAYNSSTVIGQFNWNYDPAKNGSKGLIQYGPAFKCLDCYVFTKFGLVFNLDYAPNSLNPTPKLNSVKVSFEGDVYAKYAIVIGPTSIASFTNPSIIPTTTFSTMTISTFPVQFSGSLGINLIAPTASGLTVRANRTMQAAAQVGYQYTSNGTSLATFVPSEQFSSPRFNFSTNTPGNFEVHFIPSITARFPSPDTTFDFTYQFDPWVGVEVFTNRADLCSAGLSFQTSTGYNMIVSSSGMTYQGTYIMPKIAPANFPTKPKAAQDCSFCKGCGNPAPTAGSVGGAAAKRSIVARQDAETQPYNQWIKISTSSSPFQLSFSGSPLDGDNIENVVVYAEVPETSSAQIQIFADQGETPDQTTFKWSSPMGPEAQQIEIPTSQLRNDTTLNVAIMTDIPTDVEVIVYFDIQIGTRYGKVFKLGDFPDGGLNTFSFLVDGYGDALSGFLVYVTADDGAPNIMVESNYTEEEGVWWQGTSPGITQTILIYQWQINDEEDFDWEEYFFEDIMVEFSGYLFAEADSPKVTAMVAPFVEITVLNWYADLQEDTERFYFLVATDENCDEIWIEYDNTGSSADLKVFHTMYNLTDDLPLKEKEDIPAGQKKDFRFRDGKFSDSDYILGEASSDSNLVDVSLAVYFIYPLSSGIPTISTDVNSTFELFRFELLDPELFPGRTAFCSATFSEPPTTVGLLLDFENLQNFRPDEFTPDESKISWFYSVESSTSSPVYILIEAVVGSSYSLMCTHKAPLPTEDFEVPIESLGSVYFTMTPEYNYFYTFPQNSLLDLYVDDQATTFVRPTGSNVGITSGYELLRYRSTATKIDTRGKNVAVRGMNAEVDVTFRQSGDNVTLKLNNKDYQWDYELLLNDLSGTLYTFDGGDAWDAFVPKMLSNPQAYLLSVSNAQKLTFSIQGLGPRPLGLTITVPTSWIIPPPRNSPDAVIKLV